MFTICPSADLMFAICIMGKYLGTSAEEKIELQSCAFTLFSRRLRRLPPRIARPAKRRIAPLN